MSKQQGNAEQIEEIGKGKGFRTKKRKRFYIEWKLKEGQNYFFNFGKDWVVWKRYLTEKQRDTAFENLTSKERDTWQYRKGEDT